MRPEPTSRYWPRSNELRVAGHYWLSRGGSVYTSEASEASAKILTSRIGQEGPDNSCLKIFGDILVVYNVHNLLHFHEDVEHFRCSLNGIVAFKFENNLQKVKGFVRHGKKSVGPGM